MRNLIPSIPQSNQTYSNTIPNQTLSAMPPTDVIRLLYIPWIDGHTGSLVRLLQSAGGVEFLPLDLAAILPDHAGNQQLKLAYRIVIMELARDNPTRFLQLLANLTAKLKEPVNALLVTVDWNHGIRHTTQAFRAAGIPTVLVPHESVFAREDLYYRNPDTGEDIPAAEMSLLWGGLQAEIFTRRGLTPNRLLISGSPKLDFVRYYRSDISRQDFYARWGMPGDRPVILFATQPLDNQFETSEALIAQSRSISDCLAFARQHQCRLIVRVPPARSADILGTELLQEINASDLGAIDGAIEGVYLSSPHDALYHADVVVSINSTMLLEASIMERPAISIGYVHCDQFWHKKGGLPLVTNRIELHAGLRRAIVEQRSLFSPEGWDWIRWAFSPGEFDGTSAKRIIDYIGERWPTQVLPRLPLHELDHM